MKNSKKIIAAALALAIMLVGCANTKSTTSSADVSQTSTDETVITETTTAIQTTTAEETTTATTTTTAATTVTTTVQTSATTAKQAVATTAKAVTTAKQNVTTVKSVTTTKAPITTTTAATTTKAPTITTTVATTLDVYQRAEIRKKIEEKNKELEDIYKLQRDMETQVELLKVEQAKVKKLISYAESKNDESNLATLTILDKKYDSLYLDYFDKLKEVQELIRNKMSEISELKELAGDE